MIYSGEGRRAIRGSSFIIESNITAFETGRHADLMLITPVFPQYNAILDPLSSYYMIEELVALITVEVVVDRYPIFSE